MPVGHIVHTGMLNERGGYENDCSVVRISKNRSARGLTAGECRLKMITYSDLYIDSVLFPSFFIISPTDQQVRCWAWIKQHMPNDPQLHLEDVSWKYTGESRLICWHLI